MSTNVYKGYLTCSKLKVNSMVQDTEENNVLQWEPCGSDNDDTLAGAATALSLLSLLLMTPIVSHSTTAI